MSPKQNKTKQLRIQKANLFYSAVDSRGAGGARAPQEFWGSEKGQSLISADVSTILNT